MKSDIEIEREARLKDIGMVAAAIGIDADELSPYGKYKAKVAAKSGRAEGKKLILVTAINPTKAGEGKTTVSIGLADALSLRGKKTTLALREPSLGPVFGMKGGAAGGGYAQVAPMADINLHFTGDMHAITAANNLLAAMIDNHIYWGNALKIDTVTWRRCLDVNDRALRSVETVNGDATASTGFDITAASEIMAVLCLARDESDLKERLSRITVGYTTGGSAVTAKDLNAHEAMAVLLIEAASPNLVQTLEGTPAFVHGGPFANIAHGCNSVIATRTALHYADYVVTEAGFGADLGAEKFFDIKCRAAGLFPDCAVLVATVRALKCAGGKADNLTERDDEALTAGLENLKKHIENLTGVYGVPCVVAINKFATDTDAEIALVKGACAALGVSAYCTECFARGGKGGLELADGVIKAAALSQPQFAYELSDSVETKLNKIATRIYGADGIQLSDTAKASLKRLGKSAEGLPVCVAKTQYSLSDDASKLGRPSGFTVTVRDVLLRSGAGFLVAVCGDILLMPGLSRRPNAENITVKNGVIDGLM